jgi:hypothetical protein
MRRTPAVVTVTLALAAAPLLPAASPALAAAPTSAVTVDDTTLRAGQTAVVTFTFSEAVTGFTLADVTVSGGTMTALATSDNIVYTATFTPADGVQAGAASITVDNTGVTGAGSVPGTGTSSVALTYDTQRPTATIQVADTQLLAGETSLVTVTFSEPVLGFSTADLVVPGGTVTALSSSDGGRTWTATLTPAAGVRAVGQQITLPSGAITDLAVNAAAGSTTSNAYSVATVRPTGTVTVADTALRAGETTVATVTFSEAVNGFDNGDLTVQGATLSNVSSSDGGVTWTATLTPAADVEATGSVVLDLAGVRNGDGNAGVGVAPSAPYAVDTRLPTATVAVADPVLGIGETTTVTITFSEQVAGFTPSDVTVTGGSLTALTSADGRVWTAGLVPDPSPATTTALVQVDTASVVDAAGNPGAGVVSSPALVVDNVAPTATLRLAAARVTGPTTLTVTFSEPVPALTTADLVVPQGALSALATADGGTTWTATFTPDAGVRSAAATIRLDLPGVTDAAGNPGAAAVLSAPFAVDTVAAPAVPPAGPGVALPGVTAPAAPPAPAAPAVPAAARPGGNRPLATTGADAPGLLGAAAAMLAAGLAAVRLRRRGPRTR